MALGVSTTTLPALTLGLAGTLLSHAAAAFVVLARRQSWWRIAPRLHATLAVQAGLALIWHMSWTLLGYRS